MHGTTVALPGLGVVLTAAAGAVEPVPSCRRSAPSGAGTAFCVPVLVKKAAARGLVGWLCAGALPERSALLHHYARDLLTPARCAELPPAAREAGQHWPRRRSFPSKSVALAGSDDAEARCAASRRCGGFAQSCGRCRSFDTGRSDPCARHQHGSCGRRFVHLVRFCAESSW